MEMTDGMFLERGFHEFAPGPLDSPGVERCFQKRYDGESGKRYFITVRKWSEHRHPHTGTVFPECYEYDVQLYHGEGNRDALDLKFHSSWTLDDVEDMMERIWNLGCFEHYERFE